MTDSSIASSSSFFIGIDVAKDKLALATNEGGPVQTFANDSADHRDILARLTGQLPETIVFESTGGYERPPLDALIRDGLDWNQLELVKARFTSLAINTAALWRLFGLNTRCKADSTSRYSVTITVLLFVMSRS